MGTETKIQWCHHTLNPWIGCAKVSPGCKHCYAETQTYPRVSKARGLPLWGESAHRHVTSDDNWRQPRHWDREAAAAGERRRVFCASLADVFEARDDLDEPRARLWTLIEETPALDWLLLTKRPKEIMQRIPERWRAGLPANVWVGTTVEDQARAEERIPHLLRVPAKVLFLSCEPLLERVNISRYMCPVHPVWPAQYKSPEEAFARGEAVRYRRQALVSAHARFVDWVIIGGESGTRARPCAIEWVDDLALQCRRAGVPVFVKQLGSFVVAEARCIPDGEDPAEYGLTSRWAWRAGLRDSAGGDPAEWPNELKVREFPRLRAA